MSNENEKPVPQEVMDYLEKEHGVTVEDLRWMAQYHRTVTKYGEFIAKIIVGSTLAAILSGVGLLITAGVKAALPGLFK